MQQYESVLQRLTGTFRVYLLHGNSDRQWFEERKKYLLPDRKIFAGIYKMLQEAGSLTCSEIQTRLLPAYRDAAEFVLSVFVELGFAVQDGNTYHVNKTAKKRALEESELFQKQQARIDSYKQIIGNLIDLPREQAVSVVLRLLTANLEGVQG
jgi:single-stranded-DNA-specific exonuclease